MITLFGRVLGKQNRLYLEYEGEWAKWWPAATLDGPTFPSFEEWLPVRRLPYYQGLTGSCATCLANGSLAYPVDLYYHQFRTGHCPVLLIKETG